ncbi:hypothetical protein VKT23_010765 [Stygiomarasmius scandens]|uniref:Uncharacterized protein n=1 Tax=Marasmiellus scandens TaxID=2682957 RepID=A0ABR1JE83_9AGAR
MHPYSKSGSRPVRQHQVLYHPYYPAITSSPRSRGGNIASGGSDTLNHPPQTLSAALMDVDISHIQGVNSEFDLLRPDTNCTRGLNLEHHEVGENLEMAMRDGNIDKRSKLESLQNALEASRKIMVAFSDPPVQPEFMAKIGDLISAVKKERDELQSFWGAGY